MSPVAGEAWAGFATLRPYGANRCAHSATLLDVMHLQRRRRSVLGRPPIIRSRRRWKSAGGILRSECLETIAQKVDPETIPGPALESAAKSLSREIGLASSPD